MKDVNKFIVTPKETITITISLKPENSTKLLKLSEQSRRSKNELVNAALKFAFERLEFREEN